MTEKEFHAARRMFFIFRGGDVLVAAKGDVRTHIEWLSSLFGSEEGTALLKNCTRGYVFGNRMVVYKGEDFSHWVDHQDVIHALDLFDRVTEGGIEEVGVGAVYSPDVQPWPPRVTHDAKSYYANVTKKAAEKKP